MPRQVASPVGEWSALWPGFRGRAAKAGVEPLGRDDSDPNGRFAWLLDPAGIKVELWQPGR